MIQLTYNFCGCLDLINFFFICNCFLCYLKKNQFPSLIAFVVLFHDLFLRCGKCYSSDIFCRRKFKQSKWKRLSPLVFLVIGVVNEVEENTHSVLVS